MNDGKPMATGATTTPEPRRPFAPPIKGVLRERVFKYALAKGRSAAGAVRWLLQQQLKEEGF